MPNINATWHSTTENTFWFEPAGAVYRNSLGGDGVNGNGGWFDKMIFNASRCSVIYRDSCHAVRPNSYGVYIWIRNA